MKRNDYYESMERRIEKLERELNRKDEIFGLFKKKDKKAGSSGSNKEQVYVSKEQLEKFEKVLYYLDKRDIVMGDIKKDSNGRYYGIFEARSGASRKAINLCFMVTDYGDNDGKTAVVKVLKGKNGSVIDKRIFNIEDRDEAYDACEFIVKYIQRAINS